MAIKRIDRIINEVKTKISDKYTIIENNEMFSILNQETNSIVCSFPTLKAIENFLPCFYAINSDLKS